MSREKDIERLFRKFRKNTITEEEYNRLMDWIRESGSENQLKQWMDAHWEELKKSADIAKQDTAVGARFRELMEKTDRRNRIHSPEKKTGLRYYKAAAILILFLGIAGTIYYNNIEPPSPPATMITQHISNGKKATVTLPDGTVVRLNSNSELIFPEHFYGDTREVSLRGEAFFEVVKDKDHPFIVKARDLTTKVLGTSFNVKAYKSEDEVAVSVATGLVEVSKENTGTSDDPGKEKRMLLNPSQEAVYKPGDNSWTRRKVDVASIALWKEGILSFEKTPLDEAAKMLERWYGIKVILENPELKHCIIHGQHKDQSLSSVLLAFQYALGITYKITEGSVTISGRRCTGK
ncbi:FecR family protein [Sinomicrobium weinanense]|uniref:FecR domain-containing protein n=1 Tax=Sinomicrobium weinanense TaxID=2842200 RepID=A0A926Q2Y6_9FLAO|nr:FecR domain-containing protein [Sinomicrobium weinanense]MBC9797107.1 FecR domain-containing protein [Sinomicrobium weinanense]MBU3124803.1 FecR domain-containing protein [Sinomicrobium weinanense]